jgi:hypothetical protein
VSNLSNYLWVWANAAVYLGVAVAYEFVNQPTPLPGQWLPLAECLVNTRYMVIVLAAAGTLLLAGSYATFFDVEDAFFFKRELLTVRAVRCSNAVTWA